MASMSSAQIVSATALHNKSVVNQQGIDVPSIKSEMPQSLPPPSAFIHAGRATNIAGFWAPGGIPQPVGSPTLGYPYAGPSPYYPGPLAPAPAMSQGSPEPQSTSSVTLSSHSSVQQSHEQPVQRPLGSAGGLTGSAIMVPGSPWHTRAPQPLVSDCKNACISLHICTTHCCLPFGVESSEFHMEAESCLRPSLHKNFVQRPLKLFRRRRSLMVNYCAVKFG